ncbi:MAG: endonuclease [Actinomycetospora sp.]|nr:endonuclease [Actinomycetospora sp.]
MVESPGRTGAPALAGSSPALGHLTGAEVVVALQEAAREANRQAARVLRLSHEAARSLGPDLTARADEAEQFGADEVRAALVLSHAGARRRVELAECLVERLPEVLELLETGLIDEPRARAFADTLRDAEDDLAHLVCARVLPEAPGLVLGALIARLEEVLLALDPGWAARREAAARRRRRVRAWRNPSGTGSLGSYDHPLDRVVGGVARLEALAAAARRAGARAGIDALRADAHMGLIDGLFAGLDDDQIVLALVEQHSGGDGDRLDGGDLSRPAAASGPGTTPSRSRNPSPGRTPRIRMAARSPPEQRHRRGCAPARSRCGAR